MVCFTTKSQGSGKGHQPGADFWNNFKKRILLKWQCAGLIARRIAQIDIVTLKNGYFATPSGEK